jgi:hypothetical protein
MKANLKKKTLFTFSPPIDLANNLLKQCTRASNHPGYFFTTNSITR